MTINTSLNKFASTIVLATALLVTSVGVSAESTKETILTSAAETCETAAINKYGDKSVKSIEPRIRWNKGLNGAEVKMKIRKKARSPKKFSCIVGLDGSFAFYSL